jgi:uncharacterized membrane protein
MLIAFQNNYSQTISVAIMVYDTGACPNDGNWSTHGWWVMNPGQSQNARWTDNQYVYYYAEAVDGATWDDPNGPSVYVNSQQFDSCINIGSTADTVVGMRQIDIGWPPARPFVFTVNVNP